MNILAVNPSRYGDVDNYIVQISREEMMNISRGYEYPTTKYVTGQTVEVCQKWEDAMAVLEKCKEAIKLPNAMRAMADCLEAVTERATAIATPTDIETAQKGT